MPSDATITAARAALTPSREALDVLARFRIDQPQICDYRIERAHEAMRAVVDLLIRLDTGHDPELEAALARFRTRFGLPEPTDSEPDSTQHR